MKFFEKFFGSGKSAVRYDPADRNEADVSRDLTPERVDAIMRTANAGNVEDQCRLSTEVLEKNHDIFQALQTRREAVLGCDWSIEAGDDKPGSKAAANDLKSTLEACGEFDDSDCFEDLIDDLMGALLPGFAVSEIIWTPGGGIAGFRNIPQHAISFRDGFAPRLITAERPLGVDLPPERIIYHRLRIHGHDPVRGGLIRPLAWLHCFKQLYFKHLVNFIERYGMPFLMVKVEDSSYDSQKNIIKKLIRNFGTSGGGLFNHAVEAEMLQAANNTGDVYFRLLEYLEAAICKVVLGQTASSGDSSGLSKGDSQSKVRQDILEGDCRRIERTINTRLIQPWCRHNCPASVAPPRLVIDCAPAEDKQQLATTVQALAAAGFDADPEEVGNRVGLKLVRRQAAPEFPGAPEVGETAPEAAAETLNLKQKYDAMGVAIRAGLLTATPEIEEMVRSELRLPGLSDAVKKAWEATGGIRQPITLKATEAAAVNEALDVDEKPIAMGDAPAVPSGAADAWLQPVEKELLALADVDDPEEFRRRMAALASGELFGDSSGFEAELEGVIYSGIAAGAIAADKRIGRAKA